MKKSAPRVFRPFDDDDIDVEHLHPTEIRARFGEDAPDLLLLSPSMTPFSRLLSSSTFAALAGKRQLACDVAETALALWETGPKLVVLDVSPAAESCANDLLNPFKSLLDANGYSVKTHHLSVPPPAHTRRAAPGAPDRVRLILVARRRDLTADASTGALAKHAFAVVKATYEGAAL